MDKKFMVLMVLFFVVFGVFVTTTLFSKNFKGFARASVTTDPSSQTSLIFAWPLTAKVGDKVSVNVFVRNANNSALDKKPVKLVTNLGLVNGAQESTAESDKTGKVSEETKDIFIECSGFSQEYLQKTDFEEWTNRFTDILDVTVLLAERYEDTDDTAFVKFITKKLNQKSSDFYALD